MSFGVLSIIGIVLFLYLTWRNLRENYQEELLISYSWIAIIGFLVGGRVVFGLEKWGTLNGSWLDWINLIAFPGLNYIGGYFGFLAASYVVCKINNWKFWPFLEDIVGNVGILVLFLILNDLTALKFNLGLVLNVGILILGLIFLWIIKKKYRSFVWYKSGKKGFAFFSVNFIFWLLLGLVGMVMKVGQIQIYLCLVVSLIFLAGLFILGEVIKRY